jgi:hypothetical protein
MIVSIDRDLKSEISKKQIDGNISDMKKRLYKEKRVHIVVINE